MDGGTEVKQAEFSDTRARGVTPLQFGCVKKASHKRHCDSVQTKLAGRHDQPEPGGGGVWV